MKRLSVNLATTPFVNKVVPLASLAAVWGAAAILLVLNLGSFALLGKEYRKERSTFQNQERRMEAVQKELADNQKILDSAGVATFTQEAQFTEALLKAKRFSWIHVLQDLEDVKAYGVMFKSVTPHINQDQSITLDIKGVANPRSELSKQENNLLKDPRYTEVRLTSEQKDPSAPLITFDITCTYHPEVGRAS